MGEIDRIPQLAPANQANNTLRRINPSDNKDDRRHGRKDDDDSAQADDVIELHAEDESEDTVKLKFEVLEKDDEESSLDISA